MTIHFHPLGDSAQAYRICCEGRWHASRLLNAIRKTIAQNPDYIIYDPTNMIVVREQLLPLCDSSADRRTYIRLLVDALRSGQVKQFIIVLPHKHALYHNLKTIFADYRLMHKLTFAKNMREVKALLASENL